MPKKEALMPSYDIRAMKASLYDAQVEVLRNIRGEFSQSMRGLSDGEMTIAGLSKNHLVDGRILNEYKDLASIYGSPGLYIICTTFPMEATVSDHHQMYLNNIGFRWHS